MPLTRRFPEIDYGVPDHILPALEDWIEHGHVAGAFVMSVLANDLRGAVQRADYINQHALKRIIDFLNMEAPSECWGSVQNVEAWHRRFHPNETHLNVEED